MYEGIYSISLLQIKELDLSFVQSKIKLWM